MINFRRWRIATAAAILTMLASSVAVPASACPLDPDPAPHRSIAFPDSPRRCPLHRIDLAAVGGKPLLRRGTGESTDPSELDYHQAASGDLSAALASYPAAANDAERVYAFGEAGRYLERALHLWARVPEASDATGRSRGDVLVGLAQD
jgi:hypothetical protein